MTNGSGKGHGEKSPKASEQQKPQTKPAKEEPKKS